MDDLYYSRFLPSSIPCRHRTSLSIIIARLSDGFFERAAPQQWECWNLGRRAWFLPNALFLVDLIGEVANNPPRPWWSVVLVFSSIPHASSWDVRRRNHLAFRKCRSCLLGHQATNHSKPAAQLVIKLGGCHPQQIVNDCDRPGQGWSSRFAFPFFLSSIWPPTLLCWSHTNPPTLVGYGTDAVRRNSIFMIFSPKIAQDINCNIWNALGPLVSELELKRSNRQMCAVTIPFFPTLEVLWVPVSPRNSPRGVH